MIIHDGYEDCSKSYRLEKFKTCSDHQFKINSRLKEIAKEISNLPEAPSSIEDWVGTWTSLDEKKFGLDTYSKRSKIRREYDRLVDNSDKNLREMKILAIEDLIEKINSTLGK